MSTSTPDPRSFVKRALYQSTGALVRLTCPFMFSEIEIRGMDRVPWDKPCILSPNHQNAFLDALLVGAYAPNELTFLTRASAFGTGFDWFLDAYRMVPIYRRRDGFGKLSRNHDILDAQRQRLRAGESILMFSEKEHAHTYHLRPLTRGSSRLAINTQAETERDVHLVPVGINYYHHRRPGFKVSVIFGEPLRARDYMARNEDHEARAINVLREDLTTAMRDCLLVPEETDDYRDRVDRINRKNEGLSFPEMKNALQTPAILPSKGDPRPGLLRLARWVSVLNLGPMWGLRALMRWVDDPAFAASLKFAFGMFVLPVWWLALFGLGWLLAGPVEGAVIAVVAVVTMLLRIVLIRYSNPPHVIE